MKIDQETVESVYNFFKRRALRYFDENLIDESLKDIELCCMIAYNVNFIYSDPELEEILSKVACKISPPLSKGIVNKNKYVLIDTNGSDNHGLTQQYIRAFIAADIEFAYVYEDLDLSRIKLITEELKLYPKATLFTFKEKYSYELQIQKIHLFIEEYNPSKYFMHIMPWDVVAVAVCSLIKGIDRYNINATDHAFWLGASIIDYSIEFRDYGYTVSLEKRGLNKNQLLLLPYYPPTNQSNFRGFPETIKDEDVKIFSGGSVYKIFGENGAYFKLIKRLLYENEKAQLLFAGTGKHQYLKKFINENNLSNRIHFIGNRTDILEVFENCDIYLGTYPLTGGLMSQFAAKAAKPILAYADASLNISFVEGFVCHLKHKDITYTDYEAFFEYGKRLCTDKDFREAEGLDLKRCLMTEDVFNQEFKIMVENNEAKRIGKVEKIDYERITQLYLEVENAFEPVVQRLVASKLRLKTIMFPKVFVNAVRMALEQTMKKYRS